jgi:hypothetical protein
MDKWAGSINSLPLFSMIYVNYFLTLIDTPFKDDIQLFCNEIDYNLKTRVREKIKALDYATWHFEYSPKLNDFQTISYRGFSSCRWCGNRAGSREWNILGKYILPQGVIHYMEEHGIYPVVLSEYGGSSYRISDEFMIEFDKMIIK